MAQRPRATIETEYGFDTDPLGTKNAKYWLEVQLDIRDLVAGMTAVGVVLSNILVQDQATNSNLVTLNANLCAMDGNLKAVIEQLDKIISIIGK